MDHATLPVAVRVAAPAAREALPLTERILARLGPRRSWRVLWGLVPVLQIAVMIPLFLLAGLLRFSWLHLAITVLMNLVYSYAVLHALWGSAKVVRDATALAPGLSQLAAGAETRPHPFHGMASTLGPLTLALVLTLIFAAETFSQSTWYIALVGAPLDFLVALPIATWIWTYLMLMRGLDRLGKERLTLDAYRGDKSLGLKPIGRLAWSGFWIFTANLAPILIIVIPDGFGVGLVVGPVLFLAGVVAFFLSLHGIHRQMLRVKQQQLARVRTLYAQAYEPLRAAPTLELLDQQWPLLNAAEALERRAEAIQTWPFSDALFTRMLVIATGVLTSVVVKLVLLPLGL